MSESNSPNPKPGNDPNESTTPDDVATLYSWANLHGAKYRDFSASRAQAREEARLRVEAAQAEERRRQQEEAERIAQEEAQLAARIAAEAAEAARQAEADRLAEIARQAEAERQAVLAAQEAQRQAALQRAWQPASTEAGANRYQAGFDDSASAQDPGPAYFMPGVPERFRAEGYHSEGYHPESYRPEPFHQQPDALNSPFRGMEPTQPVHQPLISDAPNPPSAGPAAQPQQHPGAQSSVMISEPFAQRQGIATASQARSQQPHTPASAPASYSTHVESALPETTFQESARMHSPFATPSELAERYQVAERFEVAERSQPLQPESESRSPWHAEETRDSRDSISRPAWLIPEIPQAASIPVIPAAAPVQTPIFQANPTPQTPHRADTATQPQTQRPMYSQPASLALGAFPPSQGAPVQFSTANQPSAALTSRGVSEASALGPVDDTLLGSRDRVASRWFALKSVFDPQSAPVEQMPAQPPSHVPALAVFSLAGGVGKTSLVASLGRALSSRGERVLLVDTAAYGLLPFFFGARDQRPGILRTFNPPGVSADAPIQLVTIDPDGQFSDQGGNESTQNLNQPGQLDSLAQEVVRYTTSANRALIDLPTASGSITRRILRLSPIVLVPILADMSSVVSVGAIESFFRNNAGARDSSGKPILPYYVLNQFDYALPLHLDVREILREQIGDRLLPFALRRSSAVSEALAEGMTVMDYAPNAVVAEDYANLAGWVRSISAPVNQSAQKFGRVRWSEQ